MMQKAIEVVEEGHIYSLETMEGGHQIVTFMRKLSEPSHDGVTNEQVISMLINRMEYLQGIMPSEYNETCIDRLKDALRALEARTQDRVAREVEGTDTL